MGGSGVGVVAFGGEVAQERVDVGIDQVSVGDDLFGCGRFGAEVADAQREDRGQRVDLEARHHPRLGVGVRCFGAAQGQGVASEQVEGAGEDVAGAEAGGVAGAVDRGDEAGPVRISHDARGDVGGQLLTQRDRPRRTQPARARALRRSCGGGGFECVGQAVPQRGGGVLDR